MNNPKRHQMQKGFPRGGKVKDIASSSRHDSSTSDAETFINSVPLIRQADNTKLLPRYAASK